MIYKEVLMQQEQEELQWLILVNWPLKKNTKL
jgi:hypothetical protein